VIFPFCSSRHNGCHCAWTSLLVGDTDRRHCCCSSRLDHSYLMACLPSPLGCDQGRRKQGSLLSLGVHPVLSNVERFRGHDRDSFLDDKFSTAWHGARPPSHQAGIALPFLVFRHFGVGNLVPRSLPDMGTAPKGRDTRGWHVWIATVPR